MSLQTGSVCELDVSADGGTLAIADCNEPMVALFSLDGHTTDRADHRVRRGAGGYSTDSRLLWTRSPAGIVIRDARTLRAAAPHAGLPVRDVHQGRRRDVRGPGGRAGRRIRLPRRSVRRPPGGARRPTRCDMGPAPSTRRPGTSRSGSPKARSSSSTSRAGPAGPTLDVDARSTSSLRCTGCRSRLTGGASPSPPRPRRPSSTTRRRASRSARRSRAPPTPASAPMARCWSRAAFNGTLAFYDGKTLKPSGPPVTGSRSWAGSLAFSDDGQQLADGRPGLERPRLRRRGQGADRHRLRRGDRHGGGPATRRARARPRPTGRRVDRRGRVGPRPSGVA